MTKSTIDLSKFKLMASELKEVTARAMPEIYREFVKNTPVQSGNARQHTSMNGKSIVANYPYAQVLDDGRKYSEGRYKGSTQAPQGMTKPTEEFALKLIAKLVNDIGNRR